MHGEAKSKLKGQKVTTSFVGTGPLAVLIFGGLRASSGIASDGGKLNYSATTGGEICGSAWSLENLEWGAAKMLAVFQGSPSIIAGGLWKHQKN